MFHPRPESPLHLSTEEPILGYLKFSAKGTKREVFGMPISNELITDDIRGGDYYDAYLEKVSKHQDILLGIPLTEPGFGDLEADTQRAIEESLKDAHGAPRGPLPPVVFRETNTGKFQPLLEVEGKKEKVRCGQAAQFYSILQTPKKKSPSRIIHLFRDIRNGPPCSQMVINMEGHSGPDPGVQKKEFQLLSDLAETRKKKTKRQGSPKTPPGSPPHSPPPADDKHKNPSSGEDFGRDHIPTVNLRQSWWKPITEDRPATPEPVWSITSSDLTVPTNNWASALKSTYTPPPENSLLAQIGDMATFMDWYCKKQGIFELTQKDMEGPAYKIVKVFHPDVVHLQFQMEECHKLLTDQVDDAILRYNVSKQLPLGGDPGHVTIQPDFFFNRDLEYLWYGRKMGRPALSISKMKAAYYPDVGLEQMVPDQMWIEEECKYDVDAMYGISHWWFQRQRFYIDRHTSEGDRRDVRTHMRILSVVRIKVFLMYGYNYMKNIVLCRADLKEYVIAERDFKYLYPSDFEDLYQTQLNLTKPRWYAKGFEYKHDFTVIDSPRAVMFRDKYGVQMIMSSKISPEFPVMVLYTRLMKRWITESRNSRSTGGIRVWIHGFGRRKTSTEARSLCLPYRNDLRQDVSSGI
ncbi:hypothetical protein Tco_0502146 [Tanacetum coccineum]